MRACLRCGTQNTDGAAACAACGFALEAVARPAQGGLKQTMLGMATPGPGAPAVAPAAPPPQQAPPPQANRFGGTMIGMQSPFAPPAPTPPARAPAAAPPAASGGLKQTMMGYAPSPSGLPQPAPPAGPPPTTRSVEHGTAQNPALGGTLIYNPPQASNYGNPPQASNYGGMATPVVTPEPAVQRPAPKMQTMLGVARPGIAPLRAGDPAPQPASQPRAPAPIPAAAPQPASRPAPRHEPVEDEPPIPKRVGLPKGAIMLMAVSAALAVTAGVVAFLWESPRPIRAEVVLDDRGTEALSLTCDDCADGTTIASGASRVVAFKSKKASLELARPLEIGKNEIVVDVKRPGIGRDEEVTLAVSVDYRVKGVLTSLAEDPPKLKVAVQATPAAAVVVDGHAVTIDQTGKGEYAIDVSHDLEGPADTILPFERKLPYTITPSGGEAHQGDVTLRFGIVPLRVDAPGDGIIVEGETFTLSGRTLKDGRITVSGRPITVDTEGRFAQLMNVSSIGETTIVVRAESKDHAPRLVRVRVKRVASLRDEAVVFRQTATDQYASIASADASKGMTVALDGEVVESRLDGEITVLLLDAKKGCPTASCLAKVVYGGRFDAKRGSLLGAYGHVLGLVDGPRTGMRIPQIAAEFLLSNSKSH